MPNIIRVIDIETLFEDPQPNGICEIGYTDVVHATVDLVGRPYDWIVVPGKSYLVNPMQPIPPETSAIHHIIDEDVRYEKPWEAVHPLVFDRPVIAYCAHGAKFEREWLQADLTGGMPWIDTYRCAIQLHPDSPTHSNNGLRYHLKPDGLVRSLAMPSHRAGPDSYVTAHLLRDFLNDGHSVEQLIKWTDGPILLPRCKIGDYRNGGRGTPWPEVETSMLRWILGKDFDDDTKFTVRHHLEQREIDQRLERERQQLNRQFQNNGLPETPSPAEGGRPFAPVSAYS